jgi:hypothetical protein
MPLPKITKIDSVIKGDAYRELTDYSFTYLDALRTQLREIRTDKITSMRRILEGKPRESIKSFPWQNASNLIVQLVASFTDQLAARMVMGIHNTLPIFPIKILGTLDPMLNPGKKRSLLEDFLAAQAVDPSRLNLIETEYTWFRNAIAYGYQAIKVNMVDDLNCIVKPGGEVIEKPGYMGPEIMPLEYEDFLIPPEIMPMSRIPFKAQAIHLSKWSMEERVASGAWDRAETARVIEAATTSESDQPRKEVQSDQKISPSGNTETHITTLYECHVKHLHQGKVFDCILTLHPETRACVKSIFRFYPPDVPEFIGLRFGGHGKRAYGLGLVEALQDYQEEVSAIHNQRRDAATAANTNALRITPGSQLDTMTTLYPMGIIPAPPGSIEVLNLGRNPIETIQDENLVRQEAAERAGVHPSASGAGSGGPNKKGVYSSMGTMSVMQEGNSRTDMNLALFRNAHVLLGQTMLGLYAHFGVDKNILKGYGVDKELLEEALEAYAQGSMRAVVVAGTASVNREVEKQNNMLMQQNLRQHYQMSMGMLQQIENPMTPPDTRLYLAQALHAMNSIQEKLLRDFGIHDGGEDMVPQTEEFVKKALEQKPDAPQGPPGGQPPPGGAPPQGQPPPQGGPPVPPQGGPQ